LTEFFENQNLSKISEKRDFPVFKRQNLKKSLIFAKAQIELNAFSGFSGN